MIKSLLLLSFLFLSLLIAPPTRAESKESDPVAAVKSLYQVQKSGIDVFRGTRSRKALDRLFVKAVADLIWKDAVAADGEVGAFDFDPLYASQDPQITKFTLARDNAANGDDAIVKATFEDSGKPMVIKFKLEEENGRWKIADISYPDGISLRKLLEED